MKINFIERILPLSGALAQWFACVERSEFEPLTDVKVLVDNVFDGLIEPQLRSLCYGLCQGTLLTVHYLSLYAMKTNMSPGGAEHLAPFYMKLFAT